MNADLKGRRVIVTGASRGIGRSAALRLAREGARLGLVSRDEAALREVADEADAAGGWSVVRACDFSNPPGIADMVAGLERELGGLDAVVNNAGTFLERDFAEMTEEELLGVMTVNLVSPFVLTREALPHLRATRGRVINIVSTSAVQGYAQQSGYCGSKAGLLGMMRALAIEEKPHGVRVHNLCPGGVDTKFIEGTRLGERLEGQPMISPDDIGETIAFLLKQPDNIDIPEIVIRRFNP